MDNLQLSINLTNPVELGELLKKFWFYTNKKLGQNFLLCEQTLENIINAADIKKNDNIIEIGPWPGSLTQKLILSDAKQIEAVELDEKVIPVLKYTTWLITDEFVEYENKLQIHNINSLDFEPTHSNYIIVANIPYYITSPLLNHFLNNKNKPKRIVLLVQKEVAEKICEDDEHQSILSLMVKIHGNSEIIDIVKKDKFFPAPKVDSAILKIETHKCLIEKELLKDFWSITKRAFSQKRKKIGNTLWKQQAKNGMLFSEIFDKLNIDKNRRPQTITIDEWKNIVIMNN